MPDCLRQTLWARCYEDSWKGLFAQAESFSHPAKFPRGLIRRIYTHLRDQYGLQPGSVVIDPFGGVALGALDAMEMGFAWIGCELEPRWCGVAEQNIKLWQRYFPNATAWIVCGDSRRLRECVGPVLAECVISSPPYSVGLGKEHTYADQAKRETDSHRRIMREKAIADPYYGTTPGELGAMQAGSVDCVLSSPPYAESIGNPNAIDYSKAKGPHDGLKPSTARDALGGPYSKNPNNLGNLPAGCIEAVIGSPPYAARTVQDESGIDFSRTVGGGPNCQGKQSGYGTTPSNLGNLPAGEIAAVIGSPPFVGIVATQDPNWLTPGERGKRVPSKSNAPTYGDTASNLASLPEGTVDAACGAVLGSPPWEGSLSEATLASTGYRRITATVAGKTLEEISPIDVRDHGRLARDQDRYGASETNLGNTTGPTFWEAARDVVRESFLILRPGGLAVWVVKAFVRKGAIVDFPGQWKTLCESVGFVTVEEIHASLVKTHDHPGLFGEPVMKRTERKSFFRRLHEKKRPDLAINHEVVWIMESPHA